jgi:predicted nucleic acid-binding protein
MNAIDTNILVYATRDPRYPIKQEIASQLIESLPDAVLLWQVACEYISVSRKLQSKGFGRSDPWEVTTRFAKVWPLRLPSGKVLTMAQSLS